MSPDVEESAVKYPPSVLEEPGQNLRFMHRRRVSRTDRNGDPLDGVVNLFDVAIVLAIGFLLAALAGFGLTDVLSGKNMTIVTNPGTSSMEVVVKQGNQIKKLMLQPGQQASGIGILIGQFWQLSDGSTIYVPASGTTLPETQPTSGATTPATTPTSAPTTTPTYGPTSTPTSPLTGTPSTGTPPPGVPTSPPPHRVVNPTQPGNASP